jgi:hypothetical protein
MFDADTHASMVLENILKDMARGMTSLAQQGVLHKPKLRLNDRGREFVRLLNANSKTELQSRIFSRKRRMAAGLAIILF